MAALPTGTVTFWWTDSEDSTSRWEPHPGATQPALTRHATLLREAMDAQGGVAFKTVDLPIMIGRSIIPGGTTRIAAGGLCAP